MSASQLQQEIAAPDSRAQVPSTSTSTSTSSSSSSVSATTVYLLAYNLVSSSLWLAVWAHVIFFGLEKGAVDHDFTSGKVYEGTERFVRLVQTGALLEVGHSVFGLVRAPILTTLMQVASRLLLVWGIAYPFPETTKYSLAYSTMLIAWSVTEVIRYSYFVFALSGQGVPEIWTFFRYNTFFVLYPLGVASETYLIYQAIEPASKLNPLYGYALYGVLATYVPGFYMLFTHMLKQRSKVMRAQREKKVQ